MESIYILEISKKIKKYRLDKQLTIQELAEMSGVTKGLISQIENGRSIPSMPVLFKIIHSLDVAVNEFFGDMIKPVKEEPVLIMRSENYTSFEKEDAVGFFYHRILMKDIAASTLDIVLLTINPNSQRPMVQTAALEYKYILSGAVEYNIDGKTYTLNAGDSILFNGMLPHVPKAIGTTPVTMIIIYFFSEEH
jgi:transcriptional regulator with XRE-family HTH domain